MNNGFPSPGSDHIQATWVFEGRTWDRCLHFNPGPGEYKLSFTIGTFLDGNLGGEGSKNALSALGAALNVSPEAFLDYKKALFSPDNHPSEQDDAFSKDSRLIKIAQQVPALKNNASFEKALKMLDYAGFRKKQGGHRTGQERAEVEHPYARERLRRHRAPLRWFRTMCSALERRPSATLLPATPAMLRSAMDGVTW